MGTFRVIRQIKAFAWLPTMLMPFQTKDGSHPGGWVWLVYYRQLVLEMRSGPLPTEDSWGIAEVKIASREDPWFDGMRL